MFKSHFYCAQEGNLDTVFLINLKHYKVHTWLLCHKLLSSKVCQKKEKRNKTFSKSCLRTARGFCARAIVTSEWQMMGIWRLMMMGPLLWLGRKTIVPSFPRRLLLLSICVEAFRIWINTSLNTWKQNKTKQILPTAMILKIWIKRKLFNSKWLSGLPMETWGHRLKSLIAVFPQGKEFTYSYSLEFANSPSRGKVRQHSRNGLPVKYDRKSSTLQQSLCWSYCLFKQD